MASIVEELIVRYKLDAGQFLSGAKAVDDASRRNSASLDHVGTRMGNLAGVAKNVALAVLAGATAVTAFGYSAMQSAARFDTMQRVFGAAVGSMEGGKRVMEGLEDYATRSAFSLEALADAAKTLAAGGMDISRFLPIIERFALVISGVDPSGLQMVAGALLRAKGGGFGEAMEIFRRAGVGTPDIRAQGINVTKGGEVMAQSKEFLNAIERISEGRLKTMADAVSGGDQTKLANVGDVIGQAFRQVGSSLNQQLLPSVVALTEGIKGLVESGSISAMASGFADLVGTLKQEDIAGEFRKIGIALRAFPTLIGDLIGMFKGANESPQWQWLNDMAEKALDVVSGGGYSALKDYGKNLGVGAATDQKIADLKNASARRALSGDPLKTPELESPGGAELPQQTNLLREIAENTKPLADFRRMILGGGEIGAKGVSAVEMGQVRRGAHGEAQRLMMRAFGLMIEPYMLDAAKSR